MDEKNSDAGIQTSIKVKINFDDLNELIKEENHYKHTGPYPYQM